ncbi:hypothetical protein KTD31_00605 [Burkholderia multivorans]|uniref:hypothetical protein n=1 Tax=Burkholderia multivorans TaxID=87883 RepID=UPI001C233C97|nr:hypothetical protein [Burkholderia multivorans]MBU9199900.1 hypothetical protein [Burkholderia multivorans]MDN8078981.1 hypothetical protein [Burkholderia multivorans]
MPILTKEKCIKRREELLAGIQGDMASIQAAIDQAEYDLANIRSKGLQTKLTEVNTLENYMADKELF